MFGKTLMLAGLARLLEVVYFFPKYTPLAQSPPPESMALEDDNASDHTLAETRGNQIKDTKPTKEVAGTAFRHLSPFVSAYAGYLCFGCS